MPNGGAPSGGTNWGDLAVLMNNTALQWYGTITGREPSPPPPPPSSLMGRTLGADLSTSTIGGQVSAPAVLALTVIVIALVVIIRR